VTVFLHKEQAIREENAREWKASRSGIWNNDGRPSERVIARKQVKETITVPPLTLKRPAPTGQPFKVKNILWFLRLRTPSITLSISLQILIYIPRAQNYFNRNSKS